VALSAHERIVGLTCARWKSKVIEVALFYFLQKKVQDGIPRDKQGTCKRPAILGNRIGRAHGESGELHRLEPCL
jgi:hypothetical protein